MSVFLCHAKEDKVRVRRLYRQLKQRGFSPWLDEIDLIGGQDWDTEVRNAVRSSDVVLVCLSTNSISKTGYVQKEIQIALDAADNHPDGQIYIVPLRLCPCTVPARLSKWQAIDIFKRDGMHRLERTLLTRYVSSALWKASDDDPNTTSKDVSSLASIIIGVAGAQPPTTAEVLHELKFSFKRLREEPDSVWAYNCCLAARAAHLHAYTVWLSADPAIYGILKAMDQVFDRGKVDLEKVRSRKAMKYTRSIISRASFIKSLRKSLPRRR